MNVCIGNSILQTLWTLTHYSELLKWTFALHVQRWCNMLNPEVRNLMFKMYVLLQEFTGFNHLKLAAICSHVQLQFLYFTLGNVYVQHIRKTTGNDSPGNNMFCLSWICLFKQVVEHMCDYL